MFYQNENILNLLEIRQYAGYEDKANHLRHVLDCYVWTGNMEKGWED